MTAFHHKRTRGTPGEPQHPGAFSVPCPECAAQPGEKCSTYSDRTQAKRQIRDSVHGLRNLAAKRQEKTDRAAWRDLAEICVAIASGRAIAQLAAERTKRRHG